MPHPHLDYDGAAEYLGIKRRHVRDLKRRRAIPFTTIGRLVRFDADELDRWVEANSLTAERLLDESDAGGA